MRLNRKTIEKDEEFLRQVSKPIIFPDYDLINNIKMLEEYFKTNDTTLALAAIQLGIPKRLIYLKNTDLELIKRKQNDQETEADKLHNEQRILNENHIKYTMSFSHHSAHHQLSFVLRTPSLLFLFCQHLNSDILYNREQTDSTDIYLYLVNIHSLYHSNIIHRSPLI